MSNQETTSQVTSGYVSVDYSPLGFFNSLQEANESRSQEVAELDMLLTHFTNLVSIPTNQHHVVIGNIVGTLHDTIIENIINLYGLCGAEVCECSECVGDSKKEVSTADINNTQIVNSFSNMTETLIHPEKLYTYQEALQILSNYKSFFNKDVTADSQWYNNVIVLGADIEMLEGLSDKFAECTEAIFKINV